MTRVPFRLAPMTAAYARLIMTWQYDEPYAIYNADPAEEADLDASFLNPDYHYYAVLDAHDELIAYRCYGADARVPGGDYRTAALDMGGGLRPDLTGQGLGPLVMQAAMAFARLHFVPPAFRVTIAAWNIRAQRACQKCGYQPVATFSNPQGVAFVIMLRDAGAS